jgi:hypothetical protein
LIKIYIIFYLTSRVGRKATGFYRHVDVALNIDNHSTVLEKEIKGNVSNQAGFNKNKRRKRY